MVNSWSFLYDELNMDEYPYPEITVSQKTTIDYGLDEYPYPDYTELPTNQTIDDGMRPWGHSDIEFLISNSTMNKDYNHRYKYSEEQILKELKDYIVRTYDQHYSAGDDKIQTLDLIEACGDGEAFCRSNILKYASRYDKKGTARRDIMKILHYAVLLMHFNDKNAQSETYPQ